MSQAGITLLIIAGLCVLYIIDKLPVTLVTTTTITMVQVAGYRFKDYFRIGGVVGAVGVTVAWLAIVSIYGLW